MPASYCQAPHCRKTLKPGEDRISCSICSKEMHRRCQQHVVKVGDFRVCFYCSLSPGNTLVKIEKLREHFLKRTDAKNKPAENPTKQIDKNSVKSTPDNHVVVVKKQETKIDDRNEKTKIATEPKDQSGLFQSDNGIDCPDGNTEQNEQDENETNAAINVDRNEETDESSKIFDDFAKNDNIRDSEKKSVREVAKVQDIEAQNKFLITSVDRTVMSEKRKNGKTACSTM